MAMVFGKRTDKGMAQIEGRYGTYIVSEKKALQYIEFLTTSEGKEWIEECDVEQAAWNHNWTKIHQNYGLKTTD